jgi:hypothetical protein
VASWLHKQGIAATTGSGSGASFVVHPRGAAPGGAGIVEGPSDESWLRAVGLRSRTVVAAAIDVMPLESDVSLAGLGYATDIIRRIPLSRGDRSEPHPWQATDPSLREPTLEVQFLEGGTGWEEIAEAQTTDGERGCVAIRRQRLTVLGAPFFGMAVRHQWMPPVEEGYYGVAYHRFGEEAHRWLAGLVCDSARSAGIELGPESPWPNGHRSALTVRFDHDRPIPEESLRDMLSLLDAHGLRASWGFLARLSPPEVLAAVAQRGHEVVLHSEAGSHVQLRQELAHFRAMGHDVRGVTAHGGTGSAGHLGQRLFEWAAAEGLEHADLLSRETHLPCPAIAAGSDGIGELPLFLPPSHLSLDVGTRPEAHALDALAAEVPLRLGRGGLVTVMNHPDIHRAQLQSLFAGIDLSSAWRTTHLCAVRLVRGARERLAAAPGIDASAASLSR